MRSPGLGIQHKIANIVTRPIGIPHRNALVFVTFDQTNYIIYIVNLDESNMIDITTCEYAARKAGFASLELVATLSGIEFYIKQGYARQERVDILLSDGIIIEACRMTK